jgi:tetratricopeptide (TPR) repeat protein
MSLPGWIDAGLRKALLMLAASALTGCSLLGGGPASPSAGAPAGATPELTSPELQARYTSLVNRLEAGDPGAATDMAAFSVENPELAGPLLNLGLARARAGDEAGARSLFERATTVCGHCGPVWNQLGILDRQQGQFAEAEKAYLHAIELQPEYAPTYFNLAVLYEIYIPRPDLALENYERYLQMGGPAVQGQDVEKWVVDLRRRVGVTTEAARAGGTS